MITLAGLYVYPVKSARGIELAEGVLSSRGLLHDRRFMVVDGEGQFLTQREQPLLARLGTAFEGDALALHWQGLGTLQVPLTPKRGAVRRVRVWRDDVDALDLGPEAQHFLSEALGATASLVYMPDDSMRAPSAFGQAGDLIGFSDDFPYLLASEASLADLSIRAQQPIPMDRFRPNLIVRGGAAYAEDTWREILIGGIRFEIVKPCTRCVITTVDQVSGERVNNEPLATLARYRRWRGKAIFAQNAIARGAGTLHLGAEVQVESWQSWQSVTEDT